MSRKIVGMLIVGVLAFPASAEAHNFNAASKVTIKYGGGKFSGRVKSPQAFCRKHRKILLFKFSGGTYKKAGQDYTNRYGVWSINRPDSLGSFYAKAPRKTRILDGHAHKCMPAESEYVQINPFD